MKILSEFADAHTRDLDLPPEMVARAKEAYANFTPDPTAAGILNIAEKAGSSPPKLTVRAHWRACRRHTARCSVTTAYCPLPVPQVVSDELSAVEARLNDGSTSKTSGGGSNMSFMLSLADGNYMGKTTGVEEKFSEAILASMLWFGQPLVYQSMMTKNGQRNEGFTNRPTPGFAIRWPAVHSELVDSDDEEGGAIVAGVAEVRERA